MKFAKVMVKFGTDAVPKFVKIGHLLCEKREIATNITNE